MTAKSKVVINGITYEVSKKIKVGKAYELKGTIYPVFDSYQEGLDGYIYLENNKAKVVPFKKKINRNELFNKIINDKEKIIENNDFVFLTEDEKQDIFAPDIEPDDGQLTIIVKNILKEENINIKSLSPKFKDMMELNNFKRSLRIHRKMSVERFEKWMEVLGYEWEVKYKKKK